MTGPDAPPPTLPAAAVEEGELLGTGAQGAVRVAEIATPRSTGLVHKRFGEGLAVRGDRLMALVRWRRDLPPDERAWLDERAAWPLTMTHQDGDLVGVLMRRAAGRFTIGLTLPSGTTRTTLSELQFLVTSDARLSRVGLDPIDQATRLEVLRATAELLAFFHERDVVVGDISPKNVLWARDPGAVHLLDCDAFRLAGELPAVEQLHSRSWTDPSFAATQNRQSDVFKLGLLVLRVLSRNGTATDPALASGQLDDVGMWMLRRTLAAEPSARPSAAEWVRYLWSG